MTLETTHRDGTAVQATTVWINAGRLREREHGTNEDMKEKRGTKGVQETCRGLSLNVSRPNDQR